MLCKKRCASFCEIAKLILLQEALTVRPPHVLLLPHPSFDADKLSSLISRLEVTSAAPTTPPSFLYALHKSIKPTKHPLQLLQDAISTANGMLV